MLIKSVRIQNFRSVLNEILLCENLTALVGSNGSGKSTFLRGLDLFYSPSPKLTEEDFYFHDTTKEIIIEVAFTDLSDDAKTLFASYLQDGDLTVQCVFDWNEGKVQWKYHGASLQHHNFQAIRDAFEAKDRGKTARGIFDELAKDPTYKDLPVWSTIDGVKENLKAWETNNSDKCMRNRDDGNFFGFKGVAQGYLGKFTRFLFVPAVRDANDDTVEGKGSVFTELMNLVVRSSLATNQELQKLKQDTQLKYTEILDPAKLKELSTLATEMTATLKTFAPGAGIDLQWMSLSDVDIPMPEAEVKLIEDGYASSVIRCGHGLQRAFILTMLQHLSAAKNKTDETTAQEAGKPIDIPDLVIAIEEPELYQHPSRQRHLSKILYQLSDGKIPGVAKRTQIIQATHSPLFIRIDYVHKIRLFRKYQNEENKPKVTKIVFTDLDRIAENIWKADGQPGEKYSGQTLLPRLQSIMTPWMSEGFFADVTVLVEGEDDRAAILGIAETMGYDLESLGFAIIPCGGKTSLDRPAEIFRQLNIPIFLIWDSDQGQDGAKASDNHRLLRLLGETVTDWPAEVKDNYGCFERNMETTLCQEIGEENFNKWLDECQKDFSIPKKKHAVKNPIVIASLIKKAKENGKTSQTLEKIVTNIVKCRA